jgi:transposase-like protein
MQRPTRTRRRHSPAEKTELLAAYRRSGLTQRRFATHAGIGYSTLTLWLRQAAPARNAAKSAFVPVPNLISAAPAAAAYRVEFARGISVEVAPGFRPEELSALLHLVQRS